ncbi:VC0807 family protein [Streptomyces telluris]|uniref:VC0807 family protein n=2 Tax=Streptomyces telluris TaxID=2720021 RepID=UPI0023F7AB63|nr:VC0807 family protein [Streptomyces telluris]
MKNERGGRGKSVMNWAPAILFGVVLPFVTYGVLTDHGVSKVKALLLISLWPAAETLLHLALRRRVDEFGVMMLAMMVLGALSALAYNSTELVFIKDSAITGLLGLVFLGSLALRRPLMFYLGRKFGTDGTPEDLARWNGLWQYPGFRRAQYLLTSVWGTGFLVEAAIRVALAYTLPTEAMVLVNNVFPLVVVAALVAWTVRVGKQGRARQAAAQAEAEAQAAARAGAGLAADGAPAVKSMA